MAEYVASPDALFAAPTEPVRGRREHVRKTGVLGRPAAGVIEADRGTAIGNTGIRDHTVSRGKHGYEARRR